MKLKRLFFAAALTALAAPVIAADVGVSVSIGQPGYYGRLDIGGYSQPQMIYQRPRVMYRSAMHRQPIYMHVPPGHARNWRKHCRAYNACGERVYFVQNNWYNREFVPRYQQNHRDGRRDDRRDDRNDDHRWDQNDRRDDGRNDGRNR